MKTMIQRIIACALLCAALIVPAYAEDAQTNAPAAQDITSACSFQVSEGTSGNMLDNKLNTAWSYAGSDASVGITLPDGDAGGLLIYWDMEPQGYEIIEYDAQNNELRRRDQSCMFPCIVSFYELLPETRAIWLRMTAAGQEIAEVRLCSAGTLPEAAQLWHAPVEKADLMVVSAHQDDELLWFGGTIPYYAVAEQRPTVVVYMANCGRRRRAEALNGLWAMGVRNYPEFINLKDKNTGMEESIDLWGGRENVVRELTERIRKYKPEVIVTHDLNGEYGHNQHKITAAAMQYAIDCAADATQFPDSAALYGAWQVKKLYIHLYDQNPIQMDWDTPLDAFDGKTALEMAKIGYDQHVSQQEFYQMSQHGKYDNSKFGLYSTTVGYDTGKNDMFENIDSQAVIAQPTEAPVITPQPVQTPQPTEAPQITEMPVATAAAAVQPVSNEKSGGGIGWIWIPCAALVIGGGGLYYVRYRALHAHKRRRRRRGGMRR